MAKRNKRGMGAVRWRDDTGKYVIDYYDNLGKRHVETIGTNKNDAIGKLTEKMYQVKKGTYRQPFEGKTFNEFAGSWLSGKIGVKERTKISYEGIVKNHLLPYFGECRIADLKRTDIQGFVKMKSEEGPSAKTIHNILLVLHQILDDAEVEGLLFQNPYKKIERPKRERVEMDYLKTNEIPVFLEACKTVKESSEKVTKISRDPKERKKESPRCDTTIHALFYTAILTGMRRGELLGLQWGDVDWLNGKIRVRRSLYKGSFQTPKSEYSKRAIDIGPRLIEVLKDHQARQTETRLQAGPEWSNTDLVFCHNNGTALNGDNLYHRDFKAILRKAGLRTIRIHDLRHTFASILIAAGHNLKYIQNQIGHSSIQVTMDLYGHLMPEVFEGAAQRSEDFVFGNEMEVSGYVTVTRNEKRLQRVL